MDKWKLHFVLLIAVALLGKINANDFEDEDDEVIVVSSHINYRNKMCESPMAKRFEPILGTSKTST